RSSQLDVASPREIMGEGGSGLEPVRCISRGEQRHEEPSTATERRLAAAWAKVLGIPENQIGRRDHFFESGGTSLSALKLAIALDRAVSLKDLTAHAILADLATLIDRKGIRAAPVRAT